MSTTYLPRQADEPKSAAKQIGFVLFVIAFALGTVYCLLSGFNQQDKIDAKQEQKYHQLYVEQNRVYSVDSNGFIDYPKDLKQKQP